MSLFHANAPCCARITPTRTNAWRALLDRAADRLHAALQAAARRLREDRQRPELDAATLRDLGLSHASAAATPHERLAPLRRSWPAP